MAKFKKFISIIALSVFCLTFLVGCGLFVLNEERYRNQTALTVGNEVVTLGEVIDYFDTNGSSYLQQGYTQQQVWDMLFPVFVQQKIMINEYKANNSASNTSSLAKQIGGNAAYLDDNTLAYIQKSVFLTFYISIDSLTMSELAQDFTFEEESQDKFVDMIVRDGSYSPVDNDKYLDVFAIDKELGEYVSGQDFKTVKYVFAETDAQVEKIVADLNERLVKDNDEDADLTVKDYIKAQNKAVSTITKNVKNNKDLSVEEYLAKTICEQVDAQIANNYLSSIYGANQNDITEEIFNARYQAKVAEEVEKYQQNPNAFASFITNLSDEDFVYHVPTQYQGQYYYVRSILIPFSDEQTELLNLAKTTYGATSKQYTDYRLDLVEQITAKDSDGNKNIAITDIINEVAGVDTKADFLALSYKYNTDPGMQNPVHSYVVSKDPTDLGYGGTNFVKEFVDAARAMINNPGQKITFAVTDYGVHVIYNDGQVVADNITWSERNNYGVESGSASWRFHNAIYTELKQLFADKQIAALYNKYIEEGKITFETDVIASYAETIDVVYEG